MALPGSRGALVWAKAGRFAPWPATVASEADVQGDRSALDEQKVNAEKLLKQGERLVLVRFMADDSFSYVPRTRCALYGGVFCGAREVGVSLPSLGGMDNGTGLPSLSIPSKLSKNVKEACVIADRKWRELNGEVGGDADADLSSGDEADEVSVGDGGDGDDDDGDFVEVEVQEDKLDAGDAASRSAGKEVAAAPSADRKRRRSASPSTSTGPKAPTPSAKASAKSSESALKKQRTDGGAASPSAQQPSVRSVDVVRAVEQLRAHPVAGLYDVVLRDLVKNPDGTDILVVLAAQIPAAEESRRGAARAAVTASIPMLADMCAGIACFLNAPRVGRPLTRIPSTTNVVVRHTADIATPRASGPRLELVIRTIPSSFATVGAEECCVDVECKLVSGGNVAHSVKVATAQIRKKTKEA